MGLHPCKPHELGNTTFSILDKKARFRWTSRDPHNEHGYVGRSVIELYPEDTRLNAFHSLSQWIMGGKSEAYIADVFDWPSEDETRVISKKITLLPFDYGELAGISITTILPESHEAVVDDDRTMLRLMAADMPLKDIAHEMNRSKSAIDARIKSLKTKLRCQTIGGLVALAIQCALI